MINPLAYFTLTYGLYIVTSGDRNKANGFIANSVFQVTAHPPKIAVSCNKNNYTNDLLNQSGHFAVSVLAQDASSSLISDFGYKSGRDVQKFSNKSVIYGETGVPVVTDDSLSYFECKITDKLDAGTHIIYIGEVMSSTVLNSSKPCLTYDYYRKVSKGAAPENAPTYVDPSLFKSAETPAAHNESYKCTVCGYVYEESEGDDSQGISAGTSFSQLPDDWVCPLCKTGKEDFRKL